MALNDSSFAGLDTLDKKYDTKTSGTVLAVADGCDNTLLNKIVYFEEYKDGTQFEIDDVKYALIKEKEIRGVNE